jgi:hypothetical protein
VPQINFHKSELFCFGEARDSVTEYSKLFGCGQGQFPINYLGIPIHYRRLTMAEWTLVEERLEKRLSSWKGKLLSLEGKLVLINAVLTNTVMYILNLATGVLHKLGDYYRSRFFWQGDSEKNKISTSQVDCCMPNPLETGWLVFLGWFNGHAEVFLQIRYFLH